jgi:integrase
MLTAMQAADILGMSADAVRLADSTLGGSRLFAHFHKIANQWVIAIEKAKRKAGMPWATFHTLRHSTASEMINAGIALNTVGEVLGHRSAASTRRYAHLQTAALRGALATVGRKVA